MKIILINFTEELEESVENIDIEDYHDSIWGT